MRSAAQDTSARTDTTADPRRWTALAVLAAVQFMLMMDVTVVNIALPHIQDDLDFSVGGLAWVVNAYVLTAGGFLLLGGRLADMYGRRRGFVAGVLVFGVSSAVCGAAANSGMLVAGRFVQGFGEALAGPAALGLIPVLFTDPAERTRALGLWGGVAALGGAVGSVVGGSLTDLVSWRWIFFVNLPVAVFALLMVPRVLPESRMARAGQRVDVVGAIAATGGLVSVVYGLLEAADEPWGSARVLAPLAGGLVLLAFTAWWETRVPDPMLPLRFFTNRTRLTSNGVSMLSLAAFYTYAFLLTLYLQEVLDYSPLETGLSYVPFTIAIGLGMGVSTALMPRIAGVKATLVVAFLGSAVGLVVAADGLATDASFVGGIMPGLLVYGFFNAIAYPALTNGALHQVTGQDAGLASGVQTAMQQVGASLGLATLVPFALRYVRHHVEDGTLPQTAQTDGYALALHIAAAVLVVAAVLVLPLLQKVDAKPRDALAEANQGATAERPTVSAVS
ncbi:MFS transporter [Yinghuangia seranimata]|uniref:MFS transporter n=1 Tax=Yinghuangia seranimata TaxID=408067 RepID=UPI00248BCD2E|nr:MFS transporter [Yinghuangia seranimata]MDI2124687.1 MFS transporter [Yinghuangia seranimata]